MLKVTFTPRYSRNEASARLRCYVIAEAINKHGLAEATITSRTGIELLDLESDVVVLQKAVDQLVFVRANHGCTGRKIYDANDIVEPRTRMLVSGWADAVTTDTECRAVGIREWFRGPVHVVADPIDYEDGPPKPLNENAHDGIVWFGNSSCFESARGHIEALVRIGFHVGAISDLTPERANIPGLELIPWSLETFSAELRKWRSCVLSPQGMDPCKSENKMVTAIYHHVMPLAAYGTLATKLARWGYADAQRYIWDTYRAEVIARRAMEVYAGC